MQTIILDIDGTLLKHPGSFDEIGKVTELLPGVREKFADWVSKDYTIILVTGRRESLRRKTINQLNDLGLPFDHLIMGLPRGKRLLVNDFKPGSTDSTAEAYCVERNKGLKELEI